MTGLSPFVSAAAKIGVLAECDGAAILGRSLLAPVVSPSAAQTADEAESSTEA